LATLAAGITRVSVDMNAMKTVLVDERTQTEAQSLSSSSISEVSMIPL
jgi:hypothetical protein